MLGKVGQIVCTLKIHEGYPSTGEISVVEIHGADPAVIFQDNLVSVFSEVLLSPPYLTLCDLRKQTFSIGEKRRKMHERSWRNHHSEPRYVQESIRYKAILTSMAKCVKLSVPIPLNHHVVHRSYLLYIPLLCR